MEIFKILELELGVLSKKNLKLGIGPKVLLTSKKGRNISF
jgi:hypothetical protein